MLIKRIFLLSLMFIISSCSNGRDDLKTSSNNKIFDNKNFQGSKRQPLYNQKYIAIAKQNIMNDDFDDDDNEIVEEKINPTLRNKRIYARMLNKDEDKTHDKTTESKKLSDENKKNQDKIAKLEKELADAKILIEQKSLEKNLKKKIIVKTKPQAIKPISIKAEELSINKKDTALKKKFLTVDDDQIKIPPSEEIKKNDEVNKPARIEL